MPPTIHFIGVCANEGFIIRTHNCTVIVDSESAEALTSLKIKEVDDIVFSLADHQAPTAKRKKNPNKDIIYERKSGGILFHLPDARITYLRSQPEHPKELECEVLILAHHQNHEQILLKIKPKLAILTGFGQSMLEHNPLYLARELHQKTGIQTIAAQEGLSVDLVSYSAIGVQKGLSKFETRPVPQPDIQERSPQ